MTKIDLIGGNYCYLTIGSSFVDYTSIFMNEIPKTPTTLTRLKWISKKAKKFGYSTRIQIAPNSGLTKRGVRWANTSKNSAISSASL